MCTCKQKSKTIAGAHGDFNYVFTCTKADGTKVEVKVSNGSDERAKTLAEQECEDGKK